MTTNIFEEEQIGLLKFIASRLIDDGENLEYTRGICELIGEIDGIEGVPLNERAEEIRNEILVPKPATKAIIQKTIGDHEVLVMYCEQPVLGGHYKVMTKLAGEVHFEKDGYTLDAATEVFNATVKQIQP